MSRALPLLVRHRMVLLAALAAVLYVPFLGARDLWYPDEPDIAEVCRAMYVSGDWIAPRRNGVIWIDYQPMVYWTACVASHALGGMSEFALRLPTALAAVALVLLTCAAGSRWLGPRAGLWAGFTLLTFLQFAFQAISYRPDVIFSLGIAAGLFVYARGCGERARWWPRIAGFALLGLAFLAKGAPGLLLPGLVLTLWHGARREWRRLLELGPLTLVALAVALPWNAAVLAAMGGGDFWSELIAQNFHRFHSGSRGHERPFWYYFVRIWANLAPWSPLLPFALLWTFRSGRWRERNVQLALWWLAAFFAVFSLAVTKRELYLLPAYPAAALLLATWLAVLGDPTVARAPDLRPARVFVAAGGIALPVLGAAALGATAFFAPLLARLGLDAEQTAVALGLRGPIAAIGAVALGGGLCVARAWRAGELQQGLLRIGAVHVLAYLIIAAWLLPALNPARTYVPQCRWLRAQIGTEQVIALADPWLGHHKMGAFGYYTEAHVALPKTEAEVEAFLGEHPHSVAVVHPDLATPMLAREGGPWRARLLRELRTPRDLYFVFGTH